MVHVAAQHAGKRDHLAQGGNAAQVPLRAGEGALGILPDVARDRERIALQFELPAEYLRVGSPAYVEYGERNGHLALRLVEPQRLRGPARQREIGVSGDPFELDGRAQPVVAADVVAPQEGAIGRAADRSGQAPVGGQLELAVREQVAAELLRTVGHARQRRDALRMRGIAGDLVGAAFGKVPPLRGHHRRRIGIDMRGQRQVFVVREADIVAARNLDAVAFRKPQVGHEEARYCATVGTDGQAGQGQDAGPEQLQECTVETDPLARRIVDHALGSYPPAGVARTALRIDHFAPAVGGLFQCDRAVALAQPARRGEAPALSQGEQQIVHRPGFEFVGQFDPFGKQLVPVLVDETDATGGEYFARAFVPADRIGTQRTIAAAQHDISAGGHRVAIGAVFENVGLEIDRPVARCVHPVVARGSGRRIEPGIGIGNCQQLVAVARRIHGRLIGLRVARRALRIDHAADCVRRILRQRGLRGEQGQRQRGEGGGTGGLPADARGGLDRGEHPLPIAPATPNRNRHPCGLVATRAAPDCRRFRRFHAHSVQPVPTAECAPCCASH